MIIDGKKEAEVIRHEIKKEISLLKEKNLLIHRLRYKRSKIERRKQTSYT